MFKKHEFTCPDVIHLMNKQKKINRVVLTGYAVIFGGMFAYGKTIEVQQNRRRANLKSVPTESTTA